jgi:hypothetical protein
LPRSEKGSVKPFSQGVVLPTQPIKELLDGSGRFVGIPVDRAAYGPVRNANVDRGVARVGNHHVGQVHAERVETPYQTACKPIRHASVLFPPFVPPVDFSDDPRHTDRLFSPVVTPHCFGSPPPHRHVSGAVPAVPGVPSLEPPSFGLSPRPRKVGSGQSVRKRPVHLLFAGNAALYAGPGVRVGAVEGVRGASDERAGIGALTAPLGLSQPVRQLPTAPMLVTDQFRLMLDGRSAIF